MYSKVKVKFPLRAACLGHARLDDRYGYQQYDGDPAQRNRVRRVESQPDNARRHQDYITGNQESEILTSGGDCLAHCMSG